jgi:hypothetical protein
LGAMGIVMIWILYEVRIVRGYLRSESTVFRKPINSVDNETKFPHDQGDKKHKAMAL